MKKIIFSLILASLITASAVLYGCSAEKEPPQITIAAEGVSEYVLIRPDESTNELWKAAGVIHRGINDACGESTIEYTTDWVNRGEEVPVGTKEILFGPTNRPESDAAYALIPQRLNNMYDYAIKFDGTRIAIAGGSDEALAMAAEYFTETYIKDGAVKLPENLEYVYKHPFPEITIGGTPLNEFTVIYQSDNHYLFKQSALRFNKQLDEVIGYTLPVDSDENADNYEHKIYLKYTPKLEYTAVVTEDGNLEISGVPEAVEYAVSDYSLFTKLFDVTSYIRLRYDSDARTLSAERMKSFSVFFLIAKVILASMPDLTALTVGSSELSKVNLTRFRPLLFIASALIMLVIGIIWLVRFVRFFKDAFSNALVERVENEYEQQRIERPGIFAAKDYRFSIKLLCIGSIFIFNMSIDNVNFFMDGIFSILCIIAFRSLIRRGYVIMGKAEKKLLTLSAAHAILNFSNFIYALIYFEHGDLFFVYREKEELLRYLPIEILTIAESVLLLIEISWIFKLLNSYTVPKIREYQRYFAERSVDGFIDEFKERSRQLCKIAYTLAAITIIYFVFYTFIRPLNESFVIGNYLASIVFIISFNRALGYVSDRVYLTIYKYS